IGNWESGIELPGLGTGDCGLGAVERYRRVTVPARVTFGHRFLRGVFDTQDGREGHREPAFGYCFRQSVAVRGIRERDIECVRLQLRDEAYRIGTMHAKLIACAQA